MMVRRRLPCAACGRRRPTGAFDVTFVSEDGFERHGFGLLGAYCRACRDLTLDPESLVLLGFEGAKRVSAIASDLTFRSRLRPPEADAA